MRIQAEHSLDRFSATVLRVVYRTDDGYSVLSVQREADTLPVTVVGKLVAVQEGETLDVQGRWQEHPRFGRQLRVDRFEVKQPCNEAGLLRYLSSGMIEGVGPSLAERLVAAFGDEVFDVAERSPERLREVSGIGPKRADAIADALLRQRAARDVMVFLQGLGIGSALAGRIYASWGADTRKKIERDPYRLVTEVEGVGFATADEIARSLGFCTTAHREYRRG